MCGHVGVAGNILRKHEDAFQELLIVDSIRGPHSTGIAAVSNYDGITVHKKALLPQDLLSMRAADDIFRNYNSVLLGHNRWATQGAVNGVNAHPFDFGNMVGAHNGTLVNQTLLPDHKEFEVDSENIFHSIQKIGVDETYKLLHGAAALVWYEEDGETLNFLRNKERPMFITYTKNRETMFWASEAWMLEGVLAKNNIEHTDIFNTVPDTYYRMHVPQIWDKDEDGKRIWAFDKTEARVLKPYVEVKKWDTIHTQKQMNTGLSGIIKTTSKEVTLTSVYPMGKEVYFYLDPYGVTGEPYIEAIDSANLAKTTRIYCHKDSWLRERATGSCTDTFLGTVNGSIAGKWGIDTVVQENSVYVLDESLEDDDEAEETLSLKPNETLDYQLAVLETVGGVCSVCSDYLTPDMAHVTVNHNIIVCSGCKDTDFGKEVINSY